MRKRQTPSEKEVLQLKNRVAVCCRVLYNQGLMANLGHITALIPGTDNLLLGFNRYTHGNTQVKDIITYDLNGRKIDGPDILLPIEIFLYTEVLKARKDIGSVVHVHMPLSMAFGVAQREILPLYVHDSEVLRFGLPTVDNPLLVSTIDRGQAIARGLKDALACHMRGHGQVIVGGTPEEAAGRTIQLEEQAKINLMALQLSPNPRTLTQTEIEEFIYENSRTPETSTIEPYSSIRKPGRRSNVASNFAYLINDVLLREKARSPHK